MNRIAHWQSEEDSQSTVRGTRAVKAWRETLMDAHRRGKASAAMREAGRLLAAHGREARFYLLCTPAAELLARKETIDDHLDRADLLPCDLGPLDQEPES